MLLCISSTGLRAPLELRLLSITFIFSISCRTSKSSARKYLKGPHEYIKIIFGIKPRRLQFFHYFQKSFLTIKDRILLRNSNPTDVSS